MPIKDSVFVIPVKQAVDYTTAWRNARHADPDYSKAFTVRVQELDDILAQLRTMPEANAVRIYLAKKPNPSGEGLIETVVLCGVNNFNPDRGDTGTDIVQYKDGDTGEERSGCYDFNYPCPNTCDANSPLLTGIMP